MLWFGVGILYVVLLITLGIMTIRKGHWVMFVVGIFFPLFWLVGAIVPPAVHFGGLSPRQADRRAARDVLVGLGLSEALPTPFLAPGDVQRAELPHETITITNPLIADESVLRTQNLAVFV